MSTPRAAAAAAAATIALLFLVILGTVRADLPTPTGLEFFQSMTDDEMAAYYATGTVPYLPAHEPGTVPGKPAWSLCAGQTYINAFTTGKSSTGNPRGGWPGGLDHPLNNAFHRTYVLGCGCGWSGGVGGETHGERDTHAGKETTRASLSNLHFSVSILSSPPPPLSSSLLSLPHSWWGKVFYNDGSGAPVTQLWNLFFSNATTDFDAVAYNATAGVTPGAPRLTMDNRPAIIIDYGESNELIFRSVVDEARLVNADLNLYLGRIWLRNPVEGLKKKAHYSRLGEKVSDAVFAALNSTFLNYMGWGTAGYDGGAPGDFYPLGYFAMQCGNHATPKLHYTAQSYLWAALNAKLGFNPPDYAMPALHQEENESPVKAGPGFPNPSNDHNGTMPKVRERGWPRSARARRSSLLLSLISHLLFSLPHIQWHLYPFHPSDVSGIGNLTTAPHKAELEPGQDALYPITAAGMAAWRKAGSPGPYWTPTAEERAAADLAGKLGLPAAIAGSIASKKLVAGSPNVNATRGPLDLTTWAVDAIEAANAAVKEAATHPAPLSSKLAREVSVMKFNKKLAIAAAVDGFHLAEGIKARHHHPAAAEHVSKVEALVTLIEAYKAAAGEKVEKPFKAPPAPTRFDLEAVCRALKGALANETKVEKAALKNATAMLEQVVGALKNGEGPWERNPVRVEPPVRD